MTVALSNQGDAVYGEYVERLIARFQHTLSTEPVFHTDAGEKLYLAYLQGFEEGPERQYHTCSACKKFIENFGGLAYIDAQGEHHSAFWDLDDAPEQYKPAVARVLSVVKSAQVTGMFLSSHEVLGTPTAGGWQHFALKQLKPYSSKAKAAHEAAAEKLQDLAQVSRALSEFPLQLVQQVVGLLEMDTLYRVEKVLGPATWLRDVHLAVKDLHGPRRRNAIFRAVATAPPGFCHPRSSMIGTLLEDLQCGAQFDDAAERFRKKMHPLQYQRPQAAPSDGQIEAAEALVEKLGIGPSLKRRFARFEDLQEVLWRPEPTPVEEETGKVFDHLKQRKSVVPLLSTDEVAITWKKFASTILVSATKIEVFVPVRGNFYGLLTAEDPSAPPILQWDREDRRNPVSWYVYSGGSTAYHWQLVGGKYMEVAAVIHKPSMWNGLDFDHQTPGVMFVLPQAKDLGIDGNALFPETLKSELHGVRAVIERYSKTAKPSGIAEATANGLEFDKHNAVRLKVLTGLGVQATFKLDRWD